MSSTPGAAGATKLELAISGLKGQRSDQGSYSSKNQFAKRLYESLLVRVDKLRTKPLKMAQFDKLRLQTKIRLTD